MSSDKGDNSKPFSSTGDGIKNASPPVDINRMRVRLLVVCAFQSNLNTALTYLSRRGWHANVTTNLIHAFQQISTLNPNFILISVNLQSNKLEKLARIIFQTFRVPVVTFAEKGDPYSVKRLKEIDANFKIPGVVSGPGIHRGIKNYLHEIANSETKELNEVFNEIVKSNKKWKTKTVDKKAKKTKKGYTFSTDEKAVGLTKNKLNKKYLDSLEQADPVTPELKIDGFKVERDDEESIGKVYQLNDAFKGSGNDLMSTEHKSEEKNFATEDESDYDGSAIENLNDFSRTDGKTEIDVDSIDLAELAKKYYKQFAKAKEVESEENQSSDDTDDTEGSEGPEETIDLFDSDDQQDNESKNEHRNDIFNFSEKIKTDQPNSIQIKNKEGKNILVALAETCIGEVHSERDKIELSQEVVVWSYREKNEYGIVMARVNGSKKQRDDFSFKFKETVDNYLLSNNLSCRLGGSIVHDDIDFDEKTESEIFSECIKGDQFSVDLKYIKFEVVEAEILTSQHPERFKINANQLVPDLPQGADIFIYLPANNRFIRYLNSGMRMTEKQKRVLTSSEAYINENESNSFQDSAARNQMLSRVISKNKKSA